MAKSAAHPNRNLISSEDVEGTDVYSASGIKIGEIDHLMIDKVSGRVAFAVMSLAVSRGARRKPLPPALGCAQL